MKAKLEFELDNFDEKQHLNRCLKSTDLCLAIIDIQNLIRAKIKYTEDNSISLDELQDSINNILSGYGVLEMDDLIS